MIFSFDDLLLKYSNYTDVKGKIRREVSIGNLTQITRGLYETDSKINGKFLAGSIYGPSYLSFEYALSVYSLIPETVYNTFTSATFCKKKKKLYKNSFGIFFYKDVPANVYPLGIILNEYENYSYQIASPEKAICDELYSLSPTKNLTELKELLFDNLRIDESAFNNLNKQDLLNLASLYHSTNLKLLIKLINKEK